MLIRGCQKHIKNRVHPVSVGGAALFNFLNKVSIRSPRERGDGADKLELSVSKAPPLVGGQFGRCSIALFRFSAMIVVVLWNKRSFVGVPIT